MKKIRLLIVLGTVALTLTLVPNATAIQYTLDGSTGDVLPGNINLATYNVTPPSTESGTATDYFSATFGGSGNIGDGWWVEFSWTPNQQPTVNEAFIKAGSFYLYWDAADFAAFNAGAYDSIRLINNVIANQPGNAYLGTSHAGLNAVQGTSVPDAGMTLVLFGASLIGLSTLRRRLLR